MTLLPSQNVQQSADSCWFSGRIQDWWGGGRIILWTNCKTEQRTHWGVPVNYFSIVRCFLEQSCGKFPRFCVLFWWHKHVLQVVVPVGPELTEASIFSKLEIPMVQLLNAPPKFMVPPSASCPPSIAGSPPTGSTSLFASFQLPSPPATTSPSLSTSCGSSPPKSVSPGYQATPTPKQFSQPSSPRHRSPRTSISDAGAPDTKLQKIPRHKRPSHRKAEIKRRVKIQVK